LIDIKPKVITMDNRNDNNMSTGNANSDDNTNETQSKSVNQEPTSNTTRKRPSQQDDVVIGVIGTQHQEPVAYQDISDKHKITVGDPAIQLEQSRSNKDDALIVTTSPNGNYSM
jgi:hypothetical protein